MASRDASSTPYDKVFYPPAVYPEAHPDRLATVGTLRGMDPAPPHRCRVLELGCGTGENLIALAFNFRESEFTGLDSARSPVALGKVSIEELRLTNIQLHPVDLREASRERFGSFDYIIAHGLYSWVPPLTRERILALCHEILVPHGIAYISYNAYPGNHLRDLARGIIRFHTRKCESPPEKVERARAILRFLGESRLVPNGYVTALRDEFERLTGQQNEVFFHDDLGEINQPFYFHEFISAARRHDLQFLGEACPDDLHAENFTTDAAAKFNELGQEEELTREQYKDFLIGRAFRRTLLCRREVALAPALLPERISKLYASCDAVPVHREGTADTTGVLFRRPNGAELEATDALVAGSFRHLCSEWPRPVAFAIALNHARREVSAYSGLTRWKDPATLLTNAWAKAYQNGFLQLHVNPARVANRLSRSPECSALMRYQLQKTGVVTSQLHRRVRVDDPLSRAVAQLLDGTRNEEAITQIILEGIRSGQAELRQNNRAMTDSEQVSVALRLQIHEVLAALVKEGLLIS
jgi:methyltransferase-like protein